MIGVVVPLNTKHVRKRVANNNLSFDNKMLIVLWQAEKNNTFCGDECACRSQISISCFDMFQKHI